MRPFSYHRAATVADAVASHRRDARAAYIAGGTTLIDLTKLDVLRPDHLVDVNRLPGLSRIEPLSPGGLRIGALVRNSDLAWDERVRRDYPVLAEALLSGASPQLRNLATTAGNLMQRVRCPYYRDNVSACNKRDPGSGCAAREGYNRMHAILGTSEACIATHPSDFCVALAALDAEVLVTDGSHERSIPLVDFHLLPGATPEREHALQPHELITAVALPAPLPGARSHYLKLRDRESYEFALASAAVILVLDGPRIRDARIALGGVGTKPWRSPEAETVLRGASATADTFRAAAEVALVGAVPRQHNAFKLTLARRVLERALVTVTRS